VKTVGESGANSRAHGLHMEVLSDAEPVDERKRAAPGKDLLVRLVLASIRSANTVGMWTLWKDLLRETESWLDRRLSKYYDV
jgi:hypothetical protein